MATTIILNRPFHVEFIRNQVRLSISQEWAESIGFTPERRDGVKALAHSDHYGVFFCAWSNQQPKRFEDIGEQLEKLKWENEQLQQQQK